MSEYNARDWFWIVGADESRAWSSAAADWVVEWPSGRVTRIANNAELTDVLRPYGLDGPAPTQADYAARIQEHVDTVARARGYNDGVAIASYALSSVEQWAAEASAFISWRDSVWAYAYEQLALVQAEQRAQPTPAELVAELPAIEWPN